MFEQLEYTVAGVSPTDVAAERAGWSRLLDKALCQGPTGSLSGADGGSDTVHGGGESTLLKCFETSKHCLKHILVTVYKSVHVFLSP